MHIKEIIHTNIIIFFLKIITDTPEKRKYLGKLEYNFDDFVQEVFGGRSGKVDS